MSIAINTHHTYTHTKLQLITKTRPSLPHITTQTFNSPLQPIAFFTCIFPPLPENRAYIFHPELPVAIRIGTVIPKNPKNVTLLKSFNI